METIRAVLMLEAMGKPADYVKETLEKIAEEIGKQQEVRVLRKETAEPKPIKDSKELFSSFTEIEIETNIVRFMGLLFNFMPAHVEIITPEELKIKNNDLNLFFNELMARLHKYDEIAKTVLMERQILEEKFRQGKIKIIDDKKETKSKRKKKKTKK